MRKYPLGTANSCESSLRTRCTALHIGALFPWHPGIALYPHYRCRRYPWKGRMTVRGSHHLSAGGHSHLHHLCISKDIGILLTAEQFHSRAHTQQMQICAPQKTHIRKGSQQYGFSSPRLEAIRTPSNGRMKCSGAVYSSSGTVYSRGSVQIMCVITWASFKNKIKQK